MLGDGSLRSRRWLAWSIMCIPGRCAPRKCPCNSSCVRVSAAFAILDFLRLGSTLALRRVGTLGSAASAHERIRCGSSTTVLDFVHAGSSLARRALVRPGAACSAFCIARLGSQLSKFNVAAIGASSFVRCFIHLGAAVSVSLGFLLTLAREQRRPHGQVNTGQRLPRRGGPLSCRVGLA